MPSGLAPRVDTLPIRSFLSIRVQRAKQDGCQALDVAIATEIARCLERGFAEPREVLGSLAHPQNPLGRCDPRSCRFNRRASRRGSSGIAVSCFATLEVAKEKGGTGG